MINFIEITKSKFLNVILLKHMVFNANGLTWFFPDVPQMTLSAETNYHLSKEGLVTL